MALSEDIRETVLGYAEEIVKEFGLEVFELNLSQVHNSWQIRLVLDKLDGFVTVEDCATVSRRLNTRIELEEVIPPEDVAMEVLSPGLNRPLRGEDDFKRFTGQLAKLKIRTREGGYSTTGRIISVSDGVIGLSGDDGDIEVSLSEVKEARLVPEIPVTKSAKKKRRKKPR